LRPTLFPPVLWLLLGAAFALGQEPRHDEIVVTGTADPIPLEEMDRSVTVLPLEDQRLLATALVDFLRLDPALDVRARAPGGVQTDVSIRGGSFGQTLVLVDGQRVNDPQTGHHSMDLVLPLEAVDRVEVLRGSGSTFYGSDATGGVVNMITRQPEAAEASVTLGAGNFGVNFERTTLAAVAGRFTGLLALERDFTSGFRPGRDARNLSLASTLRARTALGTSSLILGYSDRPFGADQFYGNYNSWEDTKTWFASLRQDLGERTEAAFSYRRHSDLFVLERYQPWIYTNHHADETYDASLRRREPLATNASLHYGLEGHNDSISSTNLGEHDRGRAAAYVSFDVRALRRFSFSLGAREEVWRRFSGQLSPNVSAGAWLSSKWKLRASASRGFRVPSYTELYYRDPANVGSPLLRPETAWTYEAGADWIPRDSVRLSAAVFERRETNNIDYVRASLSEPWRAVNLTRLNFTGAEITAAITPARGQRISVSYEALHGAEQALGGLVSEYVFNYPSQGCVLAWQGAFRHGIVARSRVAVLNRLGRPAYTLVDASAAYGEGRVRPFVQLTNLAGARYEEIMGVTMPGRGVLGGVEFILRGK
jgi:iron complex outermembrane recepter protein